METVKLIVNLRSTVVFALDRHHRKVTTVAQFFHLDGRCTGVSFIILLPDILGVHMHQSLSGMDVTLCNKNRLITNETKT